jgi:hypothetical protein
LSKCADCRFFSGGKECRRYAPRSGLGYLAHQFDDVLRDLGWSARVLAGRSAEEDSSALAEITDRQMMTRWPQVAPDDWCGEFQPH